MKSDRIKRDTREENWVGFDDCFSRMEVSGLSNQADGHDILWQI